MLNKTFAERLALHRRRLGHNQEQLGEKLGVRQTTISNWENGNSAPSVPELVFLCDLFEVSADYLLGRSDQEHGLAPDQWIVDEEAEAYVRSKKSREKVTVLFKVPRRLRIVDTAERDRLRRELKLE